MEKYIKGNICSKILPYVTYLEDVIILNFNSKKESKENIEIQITYNKNKEIFFTIVSQQLQKRIKNILLIISGNIELFNTTAISWENNCTPSGNIYNANYRGVLMEIQGEKPDCNNCKHKLLCLAGETINV